jgi:hypothetical protein
MHARIYLSLVGSWTYIIDLLGLAGTGIHLGPTSSGPKPLQFPRLCGSDGTRRTRWEDKQPSGRKTEPSQSRGLQAEPGRNHSLTLIWAKWKGSDDCGQVRSDVGERTDTRCHKVLIRKRQGKPCLALVDPYEEGRSRGRRRGFGAFCCCGDEI